MPVANCEVEGVSVVLVGSFNPAIFQPSWLSMHGMIREGEAEKAQLQVVSADVTNFKADWLGIQVTRDRFQAYTADPRFFEPLRDLVLSVFAILEHTPVHQLGINRDMHFVSSIEQMNRLGDLLAPKEKWQRFFEKPLLETIVILGKRPSSEGKVFRVTVQPSVHVRPGIYVGTNEHYEVEERADSTGLILDLLRSSWQDSQTYARSIGDQLVADALE